ncbi:hypothetical protein SeMB42_g01954 [Synchytrium endobioticum]|uniref:Cyclin-like domain-containing protein n=1 Tax=Synchytrium endobioticum TaxID=286115 RepID=A0A507D2S0_9FUNG|nr:hypothetical protein SeLEV6574_g03682 [Synchytrium endobioticum]TPX51336.1 hypothetical protein SeMB42_g01954 [Synchytrium endobioticum]
MDTQSPTNQSDAKPAATGPPKPKHLYENATQFRHWTWKTASDIDAIRQETSREALDRIIPLIHDEAASKSSTFDATKPQPTASQIQRVVRFYETKTHDFREHFRNLGNAAPNKQFADRVDDTVEATAVVFLKRFCLYNSLLEHDPKMLPSSCLYLALKCENVPISRDDFLAALNGPPQDQKTQQKRIDQLLDYEGRILRGIGFELSVRHPFWPLKGFYMKLHEYISETTAAALHLTHFVNLTKAFEEANKLVLASTLTDLPLIHWPTRIALACLRIACNRHSLDGIFQQYLESIEPPSNIVNTRETSENLPGPEIPTSTAESSQQRIDQQLKLSSILSDMEAYILEAEPIVSPQHPRNREVAADIKRVASEAMQVMKHYVSPMLDEGSFVSKRARDREEQERQLKKARKAQLYKSAHSEFQGVLNPFT